VRNNDVTSLFIWGKFLFYGQIDRFGVCPILRLGGVLRDVRECINLTRPLPRRQGRVAVRACHEGSFMIRNAVVTFSVQTLFLVKNNDFSHTLVMERRFDSREHNFAMPSTMVLTMRRVTGVYSRFYTVK
jgi:hypothetical protein